MESCLPANFIGTRAWDLVVIRLVQMRPSWERVGPYCILTKRGDLDPAKHMGRAPRGRGRQRATSQGIAKTTRKPPAAGADHATAFSLPALRNS